MQQGAVLRAEAKAKVSEIFDWRMSEVGWQHVSALLTALEHAAAVGDEDELEAVTVELELIGPDRITRIGTSSHSAPAPSFVRERLNRLVHSLNGITAPPDGRPAPDAGTDSRLGTGGPASP